MNGWNNLDLGKGCELDTWPAAMGLLGPTVTNTITIPLIGPIKYVGPIVGGGGDCYPSSRGPGIAPPKVHGYWYVNEQ